MSQCITPFGVKKKTDPNTTIPVPCGKCPNCVARRVSAWSFRLIQEDRISKSSLFVTLTYDTRSVPITRNGFMSINKRDVQLFFKRLRNLNEVRGKSEAISPIRYFLAGEYGGRTSRPHYHIILYNGHVSDIEESWKLGNIHYGTVSGASVGYTLKYMSKPGKIPLHCNDDREPEFRLMSKGLGASYITPKIKKWHHADVENRMYCTTLEGKKVSMPRYYKDKIYNDQQRKRAAFFTRLKMIEQESKVEITTQQQVASDVAAFRKMYHKNKSLDNL